MFLHKVGWFYVKLPDTSTIRNKNKKTTTIALQIIDHL